MFVDRAGGKVALQQQHSRNSRSSLGAVLEQVLHAPADAACCPCACCSSALRFCRSNMFYQCLKTLQLSLEYVAYAPELSSRVGLFSMCLAAA